MGAAPWELEQIVWKIGLSNQKKAARRCCHHWVLCYVSALPPRFWRFYSFSKCSCAFSWPKQNGAASYRLLNGNRDPIDSFFWVLGFINRQSLGRKVFKNKTIKTLEQQPKILDNKQSNSREIRSNTSVYGKKHPKTVQKRKKTHLTNNRYLWILEVIDLEMSQPLPDDFQVVLSPWAQPFWGLVKHPETCLPLLVLAPLSSWMFQAFYEFAGSVVDETLDM